MNIFEINTDSKVIVEEFMDSKIYYVDNFLKNPDKVVDLLDDEDPLFHRPPMTSTKSLNGEYFNDMRHQIYSSDYEPVLNYLYKTFNVEPHEYNLIQTNYTKFKNIPFNDYKNNYWFPHKDENCYTGIIYLNKDDEINGTNIYEPHDYSKVSYDNEHLEPWKSKNDWSLLKTIKPIYNRFVLFDGDKFFHGMNIDNERYFEKEFRKNIVIFFKK